MADTGAAKAAFLKRSPGRFFVSSMMAGRLSDSASS
jgi:hypothetical protein